MSKPVIDPARLDAFMAHYTPALAKAKAEHPDEFYWSATATVESVSAKMREAFKNGTYNQDGRAIRAACKALGIKNTRRAINAYLAGEPVVL